MSDERLNALYVTGARRPSPIDRGPVNVTGENPTIGITNFDVIWTATGVRPKPASELLMSARSTDVNDTGLIRVDYLDSNFDEFSEFVTMNGTTLVPFAVGNVFRIQGAGTIGQVNVGDITIENASTVYELIGRDNDSPRVGYGESHSAAYTIPKNYSGYISTVFGGTSDDIETLFVTTVPGLGRRAVPLYLRNQALIPIRQAVPEGTDIDAYARSVSGNASITVLLRIILVWVAS